MRVKLKDVCTFYTGTGFPKKYQGQLSGTYPFYKVGDIANNVVSGKVYLEQCNNYISEETLELIKGSIIPKNTIVFAKIGEALKLNRRAITSTDCLIDNNAMGIAAKSDKLRTLFFYYFMRNIKMELLAESTTVPSVRKSRLEAYEIDIPSLDEQKIIEGKLTILSKVINLKEKQLLKLDELVKARFVEMFGEYEARVKLSRYIKELRAGKSLAGKTKCKNKVLKTGAATFGFFDKEQYKYYPVEYVPNPLHKVEDGDVIISRMNTPELVGSCSYVFEAPDDMYYPDRLWKTIITEDTNPIFLWQLMWQQDIRKQIKENSFGTSGTMNNISKVKLLNIKAIDVPLELQNQFASFVQEIDKSRLRELLAIKHIKLLLNDLFEPS